MLRDRFIRTRARAWRVAALAYGLLLVTTNIYGQTPAPDPIFDAEGFQKNRSYFSQLPFEYIDTMTGSVILTFTDLVLPGNAGFDLRIQRTYNTKGLARWTFGVAGIPLRVVHPTVPDQWAPTPIIKSADGASHQTMRLFNGDSTVFVTTDFWRYTTTQRRLELPNGLQCDYDEAGRLSQARDPFGNTLSVTWVNVPNGATVVNSITQSVGANERVVTFTYDGSSGAQPARIQYLGRQWEYSYTAASWGNGAPILTSARSPVGSNWQYAYADADHTEVTTPSRGTVTYVTAVHPEFLTPRSGEHVAIANTRMITTRTTGGAGIQAGTWTYAFNGGSDGTTVSGPENTVSIYLHDDFGESGGAFLISRQTGHLSGSSFVADEVETRSYVSRPYTQSGASHRLIEAAIISRGGRTFSTNYSYSTSNYGDYGRAHTITEVGDVRRTTLRSFDDDFYVYIHDKVKSETVRRVELVNGAWTEVDSVSRSFEYENETGFKIEETSYGVLTRYQRDGAGNVATIVDAHNHATNLTYDWGVVKNTSTPGFTVTRDINSDGTVWKETRRGATTEYLYDSLGRPEWLKPAVGHWFQTTYDNQNGSWIHVQRSDGNPNGKTSWTTYSLDGFGRLVGTLDGAGIRTSRRYDALGRSTFESLPFDVTERGTTTHYDSLNRPQEQIRTDGQRTAFSYPAGVEVQIVEENGTEPARTTQQKWKAFGNPGASQLASVTDAEGKTWDYEYNTLGRLTRVTQPPPQPGEAASVRSWSYYAGTDLLQSETHPESGTTTFVYDANGRLESKTTPAPGGTFAFGYDANDRLTSVGAPNSSYSLTMSYDASDNRTSVSNGFLSSTFQFDGANRLEWRRDAFAGQPTRQTTYHFDQWDNLASIDYASGRQVSYVYDSENRVTKVSRLQGTTWLPVAEVLSYHPSGAIQSLKMGNDIVENYGFDPHRYWLASISGGPLNLTYTYSPVGNVKSIVNLGDPSRNQQFSYDQLDRLSTVTGFGATGFGYDALGNRRSKTAPAVTYYYDAATKRLDYATGPSGNPEIGDYNFDTAGNMTSDPSGTYTYTPFNMLQTATVGGVTTTYRYDGDNLRVMRESAGTTSYFVHGAGGQLLSEWEGADWQRDYVYLGSRPVASVSAVLGPRIAFTAALSTASEAQPSVTITVKLMTQAPLTAPLTASFSTQDGTAVAGADYVQTSGPLSFGTGTVNGATQSITISLLNEGRYEATETFQVVLGTASGGSVTIPSTHTVSIANVTAKPIDINRDGKVDLIWHHITGGNIAAWFMNGTTLAEARAFSPDRVVDTNWRVVSAGDMNGDGKPDLIWHHQVLGQVSVWFMNDEVMSDAVNLTPTFVTPDWRIVGTGDFDRDGNLDLVWQKDANGYTSVRLWYMTGTVLRSDVPLTTEQTTSSDWKVRGVTDVNRDGKPDLIWQHSTAGWISAWIMDGAVMTDSSLLTPAQVTDTNWIIRAMGDFNDDGYQDLIWQHETLRWLSAWQMNGTTLASAILLDPDRASVVEWKIAGPK